MVKMDAQSNHFLAISHYPQSPLVCQSDSRDFFAVLCFLVGFFQVDTSLSLRVARALIVKILPLILFYFFFKTIKQF